MDTGALDWQFKYRGVTKRLLAALEASPGRVSTLASSSPTLILTECDSFRAETESSAAAWWRKMSM
jgi:hypothetical protein